MLPAASPVPTAAPSSPLPAWCAGQLSPPTGVRGTDFLNYEAYTEMAEAMLARIGDEIKQQWPKVQAVSILHRTGRLEIGEASVVIAIATPHRGDGCFEACSYAIERLKAIVPIWKQENWSDGAVWIEGPRQPELAKEYVGLLTITHRAV